LDSKKQKKTETSPKLFNLKDNPFSNTFNEILNSNPKTNPPLYPKNDMNGSNNMLGKNIDFNLTGKLNLELDNQAPIYNEFQNVFEKKDESGGNNVIVEEEISNEYVVPTGNPERGFDNSFSNISSFTHVNEQSFSPPKNNQENNINQDILPKEEETHFYQKNKVKQEVNFTGRNEYNLDPPPQYSGLTYFQDKKVEEKEPFTEFNLSIPILEDNYQPKIQVKEENYDFSPPNPKEILNVHIQDPKQELKEETLELMAEMLQMMKIMNQRIDSLEKEVKQLKSQKTKVSQRKINTNDKPQQY